MSKALTTSVFAAVAAFALNGCLGGGMVVDASEPPDTDTETDTNGTEATPFSNTDPAGPLAADRREQIVAAKRVPVREIDAVIQTR
jgi:hypothetical protein